MSTLNITRAGLGELGELFDIRIPEALQCGSIDLSRDPARRIIRALAGAEAFLIQRGPRGLYSVLRLRQGTKLPLTVFCEKVHVIKVGDLIETDRFTSQGIVAHLGFVH